MNASPFVKQEVVVLGHQPQCITLHRCRSMLRASQRRRTAFRAEVHYHDRFVMPGMYVGWFMIIYENHNLEPSLAENCPWHPAPEHLKCITSEAP